MWEKDFGIEDNLKTKIDTLSYEQKQAKKN